MNASLPPSQLKYLPLIQDPPASPARAWLNKEIERLAQTAANSPLPCEASNYLDLLLRMPSDGLESWAQHRYEQQGDPAPVFLLFESHYSDDQIGEGLPAAVVFKIDRRLLRELEHGVERIASGLYKSLEINIPPENVRWLSKLAFLQDNTVAPIGDWFDPEAHHMVGVASAMDMEIDEETVTYDDACQVYQGDEMVDASALTLSQQSRQIFIGARGYTKDHVLGTIVEPVATLKGKLAPHAPQKPTPPMERP